MGEPLVLRHQADGIVRLALNYPEKRNALSRRMLGDLREALGEAEARPDSRIIILGAEGHVFSSGHDLRELVGAREDETRALFELCTEVMERIRRSPLPVIAQVQGLATAAGCQLVATCDLVIASEEASFATPGVKIGLFCSTPAVALCRAVSTKKAMEMLLTGELISARQAEAFGLVNKVVPPEDLEVETRAMARQIIEASAYTLAVGKRAFYEQVALDRPDAYSVAQRVMVENALARDGQEGMNAFLEKRPPHWNMPAPGR